jgi:hypothetical protein
MEYYTVLSVEYNEFNKIVEKLLKLDRIITPKNRSLSNMVYYNSNKKILNTKRTDLYKLVKDTSEYKLKKRVYNKNYSNKQKAKLI